MIFPVLKWYPGKLRANLNHLIRFLKLLLLIKKLSILKPGHEENSIY